MTTEDADRPLRGTSTNGRASWLLRLQATGIARLGSAGRGFRYRRADRRPLRAADRARIAALVIPPAWQQVWIAASATARVQAVGFDQRGRLQYRYHAAQAQRRERQKAARMLLFAAALPRLRRRLRRDLAGRELSRERVMACIVRILTACFLRPGSQAYAAENGSYGIATLRPQHVQVRGDRVRFDFPGKSGRRQLRELRDRRVAAVLRQLLAVPSREVFKFLADADAAPAPTGRGRTPRTFAAAGRTWVDVRRRDINAYIKQAMGGPFSAKDFRTWAGTLVCACALACGGPIGSGSRLQRRQLAAAVQQTAAALGNTAAVCRSSYILSAVLDGYRQGQVIDRPFADVAELAAHRGCGLHAAERALLRLLRRRGAGGRPRRR